ncbi:hypothetical protein [Bacillus sp. FJAT-45037]|uniref:hypothetical protein n=1 Tax=Bacillus sp. FJAT-45037 TaxID=2011007 RepID=UPI000C250486|nr:hypothetical protein [Bacillus sp. FJAT-45037]
MHAFILLVISFCLLMLYGGIYSTSRLIQSRSSDDLSFWRKKMAIMFSSAILSGALFVWLLSYV